MSSEQETIDAFGADTLPDAAGQDELTSADWDPLASRRRRCANCGAFVTAAFERVAGGNDDAVWACHECGHQTGRKDGGER